VFGRRKREEAAAEEAVREAERRALFERLAQRPDHICPFLGIEGERAGYVEGVSDEHRCFAFGDPTPLSAEQQTRVCQERGYGNCPRYLRGVLVIPTEELEALRQRRGLAPKEMPTPSPMPLEESGSRFNPILFVGLLLLIVAIGGVGAYFVMQGNPPVAQETPTPEPSPSPSPSEAPESAEPTVPGTPLPTPPPVAWTWVGCEPGAACEQDQVRRDEMALFLTRAFELPPYDGDDRFGDIEDSDYRNEINAVAAAGLTVGCTVTEFCPSGFVTRAQMATFIQRAFRIPDATSNHFTDDDGSIHENAINAIFEADIAQGCGGTNFCPDDIVLRGEMAGYLSRALATLPE
jgi:hypothetical protein